MKFADTLARPAVQALAASKIREVANAGIGRPGVLPFWFGEPDTVTPDFICQEGIASLRAGETFYTHNLGIAPLREALAGYVARLHGACGTENLAVTNSGMNALALVQQALIAPADRVVVVTPVWPNLVEGPKILGAQVCTVALDFGAAGWTLDVQRLLDALTPQTRLLIVNSPNNPTGWTMPRAQQQVVMEHCRKQGIWILADDAYERLYFDGEPGRSVAPSFLDISTWEDRVVSVNTFSKSWQMTGWRLGWIAAPQPLIDDLAKLIEFNTSCAPGFVQRAGVRAVTEGEAAVASFVARLKSNRDFLIERLNALPQVQAVAPPGAMYAFFKVQGVHDSLAFCKRLVTEFDLGLAPGAAFGPEGEGFIRWCFAATEDKLADGVQRLARGLQTV
ncbi:MAG: pyridoxal phosphate-dependent aminotransferase [Rhodoferax sp.]|nr:pyridoxal phosphate-dependent aminotransferase [Rhodoferax sp.]MCF8208095.1 pyridoxal phosphate-dependent aminotransferase [Rhodoferax sp.]